MKKVLLLVVNLFFISFLGIAQEIVNPNGYEQYFLNLGKIDLSQISSNNGIQQDYNHAWRQIDYKNGTVKFYSGNLKLLSTSKFEPMGTNISINFYQDIIDDDKGFELFIFKYDSPKEVFIFDDDGTMLFKFKYDDDIYMFYPTIINDTIYANLLYSSSDKDVKLASFNIRYKNTSEDTIHYLKTDYLSTYEELIINLSDFTNISPQNNNAKIHVYPNPTSESINIEITEEFIDYTFELININGIVKIKQKLNKNGIKLKISDLNLTSGYYTLIFTSPKGKKINKKLVIM